MTTDSISLKDFIKTALEDICGAVEEIRAAKPYVAKHTTILSEHAGYELKDATQIEFDIAASCKDAA